MCVCVCVCVCVRESVCVCLGGDLRERESECVCVCVLYCISVAFFNQSISTGQEGGREPDDPAYNLITKSFFTAQQNRSKFK